MMQNSLLSVVLAVINSSSSGVLLRAHTVLLFLSTPYNSSLVLLPFTGHMSVVMEWYTLMLHIRDVPDSNLDQETGYPD
jgi:hypothetical protein